MMPLGCRFQCPKYKTNRKKLVSIPVAVSFVNDEK